jgi:hypothetical protein
VLIESSGGDQARGDYIALNYAAAHPKQVLFPVRVPHALLARLYGGQERRMPLAVDLIRTVP